VGDAARCRHLLGEALAAAADPEDQAQLIDHLRDAGRLADAIELLEAGLRADPGDGRAGVRYGMAIKEAFARVNGALPGDGGGCPCGVGASWAECCEPRECAALEQFADRSGLVALRDAVGTWLAASGYGPAVAARVARELPTGDDLEWEPADHATLAGWWPNGRC
jgi:hypothetical protein